MQVLTPKPPQIGERLLKLFIMTDEYFEKLGDFEEGYFYQYSARGKLYAWRWYWTQIITTIPLFIKNSILWSIIMIRNYFKVAFRQLNQHKGYSFINIMGLAVGMACCILILLWVQDEFSYDKFHANSNELYRTTMKLGERWGASSPWAMIPVLKEDYPEIIKGTRYARRTLLANYADKNYYESVAFVDDDFFDMFTFPLVEGNRKTLFTSINSVVISEKAASKYFQDEQPLGKVLKLNNDSELIVTGIVKNVPANSHMQFDMLVPVELVGEERLQSWWLESNSYILVGKNIDVNLLRTKIANVIMEHDTRTDEAKLLDIQPLSEIHLHSLTGSGPIIYVYIFSTIAFFILLIACINFMNLTTARSVTRAKEISMRKVVGALKTNIIRQFYCESIITSLIAFFCALLLVYLFLPSFNTIAEKSLSMDTVLNSSTLIGLFGIVLLTGLISGSYPALVLSGFKPAVILKGSFKSSSKGLMLRRILVVGQFVITIVLIIGTFVIYKQLNFIRHKNLGFNKERIVVVPMNSALRNNYDALKAEMLQNSQILNVTSANNMPTNIGNINPVYWEGHGPEDYVTINFATIDYDYFEIFGMEFAHGRGFSREFSTDKINYVINEAALRLTGLESPIGKMFSLWNYEGTIIGVVKDFHSRSLHNEIAPVVFVLTTNWPHNWIFVKIKPDDIPASLQYVEETVSKFAPSFPLEHFFLDESFDRQYRLDQRIGTIFKYFSILAIFISCLGLLGMASFVAEQRTKEIGIRKTLGASVSSITALMSREFLLLIIIANVLAWPIGYLVMERLLRGYAYKTDITIWIFFTAGLLACAITLLSVGIQTLRAARANPVDSLRYE